MKKGWKVILIIVVVAIIFAAVCVGVGMITGASMERIEDGVENFFADVYNIDFEEFVNSWLPSMWQYVSEQ